MSGARPSDDELVRRCLAADEEAWTDLVDRYADYVYALALRGFHFPPEEAEEVVGDTFAQVYVHLVDYRGTGPLRAWMGTIAKNVARQRLRSRSRRPEAPLPPETVDAAQEQALHAVEEEVLVGEALARLEPSCVEIIRRFFMLRQTYAEIAAAMGIAEGTVASRLSRCLVRLRQDLSQTEPGGKK